MLLRVGQQVEVGKFTVRHDGISVNDDGQKQMITGTLTVFKDEAEVGQMYPARWFFHKHETEPTTEVAIRRRLSEDLYIHTYMNCQDALTIDVIEPSPLQSKFDPLMR